MKVGITTAIATSHGLMVRGLATAETAGKDAAPALIANNSTVGGTPSQAPPD
ncbi:MAG: hypothetical protein JOZ31_04995 [Verrucomicrobia bacterium]|nr:hypothetical protein [Verrucomicrobiota bacterium]